MVAAAFRGAFILIDADRPGVVRERRGRPLHVDAHALVLPETPRRVVPVRVARVVGDVGKSFILERGQSVAFTWGDVRVPNEELRIPHVGVMGCDVPIADEGQT